MSRERVTTADARVELQSWYLSALLPKLARAAGRGAADAGAVAALDAEVRQLLDLAPAKERAA